MSQQKKKHLLLGRFGSVYSKEYPEKVSRLGFEPSLDPSPLSTRTLTKDSE